jgi:hypothetical protein
LIVDFMRDPFSHLSSKFVHLSIKLAYAVLLFLDVVCYYVLMP